MRNLTMARSNKVDPQVQRVAVAPLVGDAFELRDPFGAYDAFYAIVARSSGARLVTCDRGLARAANGYCDFLYIGPR